jgi:lysozyme
LARLKLGLRRWLEAIEAHYKVKPIIYTGEKYYDDFLKEEFSDYLFGLLTIIFIGKNRGRLAFGSLQRKVQCQE